MASAPTSHCLLASLKPMSRSGLPFAAAALAGSADEPRLNQLLMLLLLLLLVLVLLWVLAG
jgi:hypothetical protein